MTDTQSTDLLDALVVEVIRAEEAGEYVDRDAMLADHPECAEELRQFFADREQLRRFVKAEAPKLKPGTQIGRYKLLQQIGEGGFGAVYMAEQTAPVQRHVALKIIKPGMDSRQVIARFEAERQALALMDHMNLAKVLDAGTSDGGRPFFVMELVKGVPITRYCDKNRLTIRERLELFVPVCQAIQHAHQKGIIHRDIKPSNVLVSLYDGRPVPKVIDFGIAKALQQRLTERTLFTEFGQVIGTLEYMSPEQAEMNQLDVDTRSDVYSLGVLLYEIVTGTTPFTKEQLRSVGFEDMLRTIREVEPAKPSRRLSDSGDALPSTSLMRQTEPDRLVKVIRGEIDWIVMKALEKDRARRYDTANELAADLQRYLAHEAVAACPPSLTYQVRKFARRHRTWLTAAAVLGVMLLTFSFVSTGLAVWAIRERRNGSEREREAVAAATAAKLAKEQATAAAVEAEKSRDLARRNAYAADMYVAGEALHRDHDVLRVKSILNRYRPTPGEADLRGWEWRYLWQFCQVEADGLLATIGEPSRSVTVSPDQSYMAIAGDSGRLELWNVAQKRRIAIRKGLQMRFRAPQFSPNGQLLVAVMPGGIIELVTVPALVTQHEFSSGEPFISAVAFSPDGTLLAASGGTSTIVWSVSDGRPLAKFPGKLGWAAAGDTCFSPDGEMLYIGNTHPGSLRAFHVASIFAAEGLDQPPAPRFLCDRKITSIAVSSDSTTLAYSVEGVPYDVFLIDAKSGAPIATLSGHHAWIMDLLFDSSGDLWSASNDNTIRVWDVTTRKEKRSLRNPTITFRLAELGSQRCILSVGADGVVHRWNMDKSELTLSQRAYQTIDGTLGADRISRPAVTPDEQEIVFLMDAKDFDGESSAFVNHIELARIDDVRQRRHWNHPGLRDFHGSVEFVDQDHVAAGSLSGKIRVFRVENGEVVIDFQAHAPHTRDQRYTWLAELCTFADHVLPVHGLLASRKLVTAPDVDTPVATEVKFWSTKDWQESHVLVPPQCDYPFDLMWFSPDERVCAIFSNARKELSFWSTTTGAPIQRRKDVQGVAFSPSHPNLVAAISIGAGTVHISNARDFSTVNTFQAHSHQLTDVCWLPTQDRLVTGSKNEEMVRLWDVDIDRMLLTLPGRGYRPVLSVSDQGNVIVARDVSGIINIWRAPTWEEIEQFERGSAR